jgi:hypothetical protein
MSNDPIYSVHTPGWAAAPARLVASGEGREKNCPSHSQIPVEIFNFQLPSFPETVTFSGD